MLADVHNNLMPGMAVLPDGNGGFTPCPALLTEAEAILYLRIDRLGRKDPAATMRYYRERNLLKATRIGGTNFYRREALDAFLVEMENRTYERRKP